MSAPPSPPERDAPGAGGAPAAPPPDPVALLRSRAYVQLLVLAALIGVPVSAIAYGFLYLVDELQKWLFESIPKDLGFDSAPMWWPLPLLFIAGVLCALAIIRLPGTGGHSPADGFKASGPVPPKDIPGIALAALATLGLGVSLGPEAPLIALGSGLGVVAVRLAARDAPPTAASVMAAAGSFAAISTLMGSPLLGAFLLLEASGLGGPMLGVVLVPGLLAAGVGSLIFIGLDDLTGLGTFSLTIPGLPHFGAPTVAQFGWALAIGLAAPLLGVGIQRLALAVRPLVEPRMILLMPVLGLAIAGLAIAFDAATDKGVSLVLFSGQEQMGPLINGAAGFSVGALLLLVLCKSLAYALSLSSFRGGPIFPALFIGAAGGIAASHLPGLDLVPAIAMGIGAMSTAMLGLPIVSVLLATVLLGSSGTNTVPLVIVAVVVSYVIRARIAPAPPGEPHPAAGAAPVDARATAPAGA